MPRLAPYSGEYQQQIKDFVIAGHEEFGFPYDVRLDADLENPVDAYISGGGMFSFLEEKGKVIGTIAVRKISGEIGEIKRFYVAKEYRGQKYGSELLDFALAFCSDSGFKKCVLDTDMTQKDAQRLYERRGFKIYRQDKDTLLMERTI